MRRRRTLQLVACLSAVITLALLAPPTATHPTDLAMKRPFSIVPLQPATAEKLRAQGRELPSPFPNSANQGRKFNPWGDTIPPLATAQEQRVLVIFVEFTTPPPGGPAMRVDLSYFDDMLFGETYDPPEYADYSGHPTNRTLKNYFSEVSYGQVDIITVNMPSKLGWAQAGHSYDYYCPGDNGFGRYPNNAPGLVVDAVNAVDDAVDFSEYAVDGEVPNLFVVHAGTGAEWSADPNILWSHSWNLTYGAGAPLELDGVKVDNYALMPEVGGDLTDWLGYGVTGPYPPTVGVYAHEYAHVLGLPDQYDYGYESNGTGPFSLMAYGSWNGWSPDEIFSGDSPAHLDAWSKYRLGVVTPIEITTSTSAELPPVVTDPVVYKMTVPFSGGKEYFLFENRQQLGFDEGLAPYGEGVHGLAIWHVDETALSRNYWRANEAENWKEFRSEGWRKAWTGETHYAISIIQADDRWTLERGYWGGFQGDLYPGLVGVTRFGSTTRPNSSNYYFWGGSTPKFGYSGATVTNIQESDGVITASFSFVPWTPAGK